MVAHDGDTIKGNKNVIYYSSKGGSLTIIGDGNTLAGNGIDALNIVGDSTAVCVAVDHVTIRGLGTCTFNDYRLNTGDNIHRING